MKKLSVICMAALALLAMSCKKNEKNDAAKGPGFRATLEAQGGDSKTHLDGDAVKWTVGDEIRVKNSSGTVYDFTAQGQEEATLTFNNDEVTEDFYQAPFTAYYPKTLLADGQFRLPETQTYVANLEGKIPMAAYSEDNTLEFKNICGMLCLNLKGICTVKTITITSKNDEEMLWGAGELTLTGKDNVMVPSCTLTGGTNAVILDCGDGEALEAGSAKQFYVVLPANSLTEGFEMKVTTTDNKVFRKSSNPDVTVTVGRSQIVELGEITVTPETEVAPILTVTAGCVSCTYTVGGSVKFNSGSHECEYGVVYSATNEIPTINDTKQAVKTETVGTTPKDFVVDIVDWNADVYYVRSYAIYNGEVYYSEDALEVKVPKPLANNWKNGHSPYPFTVGPGKKVYFSQGNLQYKAKGGVNGDASASAGSGSNVGGTWRFAEHQFDFVSENNVKDVSNTSEYWIDMFSWSSSGNNHNNKRYQPWSRGNVGCQQNERDNYYAYGDMENDFYSNTPALADWGYNAISNAGNLNSKTSGWRTLVGGVSDVNYFFSPDFWNLYNVYQQMGWPFPYQQQIIDNPDWTGFHGEWNYLLYERPSAANLVAQGSVGCVNGLIILPDAEYWHKPSGVNFNPCAVNYANKYTYAEWSLMEEAGAVFMPANGTVQIERTPFGWMGLNEAGYYWTSTHNEFIGDPYNLGVCDFVFLKDGVYDMYHEKQMPAWVSCYGHTNLCSVRLVIDASNVHD